MISALGNNTVPRCDVGTFIIGDYINKNWSDVDKKILYVFYNYSAAYLSAIELKNGKLLNKYYTKQLTSVKESLCELKKLSPEKIDIWEKLLLFLDNQISDEEYNKFMDKYFPNVNNYQWSEK